MSPDAATLRPTCPGSLIAIDVGGTHTRLACYDPASGNIRRSQLVTHASGLTGRPALHRLIDAAKHCAQPDARFPLLGVAAVFPGIVHKNRLLMAPNAARLEGIDLRHEFEAAFGNTSIVLDNDVKAGALAEHAWGSLRGVDHALYLNIGTGLAAAAIIDGKVYRGSNGAALEIGYQLPPFSDRADPSQWVGWQDNIAPMEALISGGSLDTLARKLLGPSHSARDLFQDARLEVQQDLQRRFDALAAQLVNLSVAFDVERIAIGGGVSRQYPVFGQRLSQLIQRFVPFPPTLVTARFAYDAPLWGALELARQAIQLPALPDSLFDAPAKPARNPLGQSGLALDGGGRCCCDPAPDGKERS